MQILSLDVPQTKWIAFDPITFTTVCIYPFTAVLPTASIIMAYCLMGNETFVVGKA